MYKRPGRVLFVTLALILASAGPLSAQAKLPGGVTSRLGKIEAYLKSTEARLQNGSTNRNDLDMAIELMKEIKKSYPETASHPDVQAAEKRIAEVEAALAAALSGKAQAKTSAAASAAASEQALVDWAKRLAEYKPDGRPGSKGLFGISTEDIDQLLAQKPNYEKAKVVYAEFLASGLDKDAHPELRQAEYDIKVGILNYERSRDRIPEEAAAKLDEALAWMNARQAEGKAIALDPGVKKRVDVLVEQSGLLFPGSSRTRALISKKAELDKRMEEMDKTILEKRVMSPDVYKGKDAEELRNLARSAALKEAPGASVLKANITKAEWQTESVVEWTDTTKTAVQHRVTDSIYAQVALKLKSDVFLYTVYIGKDTIGGKSRPVSAHVMYKDRLLEANIR